MISLRLSRRLLLSVCANVIVGVVGALAPVPCAAAAETVVAPVGGPVDARGSHLAYSRPKGKGYGLVVDGADAGVNSASRPFDVDLGTDARGRTVATYTRRGGGIRWLELSTGRERSVPGAADGYAPSVSRGKVLFATRSQRGGLRLARLTGGPVRRLPTPGSNVDVDATELAGNVLAFTAGAGDQPNPAGLWFARVGQTPRRLLSRANSDNQYNALLAPQISSRWVTAGWVHDAGPFEKFSRAVRVSPARRTEQRAALPDVPKEDDSDRQRELEGLALGANAAYTSACGPDEADGTSSCRLVRTTLRWR